MLLRCSKCGSYIDNHNNVCPVCGTVVDVVEKSEVIQAEIGNKIDMFLNDQDDHLKTTPDGVDMQNGQLDVSKTSRVSDTIKFNEADNDSVFKVVTVTAGKQQLNEDETDSEDLLDELIRESGGDTGYDGPKDFDIDELEELKEKRALSTGALIAIIAGGVVVVALIILLITGVFGRIFSGGENETPVATETTKETETETAAQDVITASVEDGGTYMTPLEITLSSSMKGAIYYTLDGTEPSRYSKRYTGPVKISEGDLRSDEQKFTLRAISLDPSANHIGSFETVFTVKIEEVEAPVFSLSGGDYTSAQSISITAQEGAVVYYTYDGSTPDENSARYSGPISMKRGNNILSAIAVKNGRVSEVSQAVYDLVIESAVSREVAQELIEAYLVGEGYLSEDDIPDRSATKESETESAKEDENSSESASAEEETTAPETEPETEDDHEYYRLIYSGTTLIGESQYHVFEVDIITAEKEQTDSFYLGVEDQNGSIEHLSRDGNWYSIE